MRNGNFPTDSKIPKSPKFHHIPLPPTSLSLSLSLFPSTQGLFGFAHRFYHYITSKQCLLQSPRLRQPSKKCLHPPWTRRSPRKKVRVTLRYAQFFISTFASYHKGPPCPYYVFVWMFVWMVGRTLYFRPCSGLVLRHCLRPLNPPKPCRRDDFTVWRH
jgi:hypothetical protein